MGKKIVEVSLGRWDINVNPRQPTGVVNREW